MINYWLLLSMVETNLSTRLRIWLTGISFLLFQFFLQLSSGVLIGDIMQNMHLSALAAGMLSAAFYCIYTSMQIPVGILFDWGNPRFLLTINALLCSLGCFVFASAHNLSTLFLGRILIGAGSSFAFIGLSHLLRQHFPLKQFGFMIGLSETLGFVVTVFGIIGLGTVIAQHGWRGFINMAGIVGLVITNLCWKNIPTTPKSTTTTSIHYGQQFLQIIKNKTCWINGLFVGLSFSIITVFGALWAVPFLQVKLRCNVTEASIIGSMIFLGAALSCPLFGYLSTYFKRRKPLLLASCLSTTGLLLTVLYLPTHNLILMGFLMFSTGLCCGAYMLAYTIANELSPNHSSLSTSTGFANTLAIVITPIFQPLIGYLLDNGSETGIYTLVDYQNSLLTIPCAIVIASILVLFLPEKKALLIGQKIQYKIIEN